MMIANAWQDYGYPSPGLPLTPLKKNVWAFLPGRFRRTFVTRHASHSHRIGQPFKVLYRVIFDDDADDMCRYRIVFADGGYMNAFGSEVCIANPMCPDPKHFPR